MNELRVFFSALFIPSWFAMAAAVTVEKLTCTLNHSCPYFVYQRQPFLLHAFVSLPQSHRLCD